MAPRDASSPLIQRPKGRESMFCTTGDATCERSTNSLCLLSFELLITLVYRTSCNVQQTEIEWRKQSAETFLASMAAMGAGNALAFLESNGLQVAKDIRREIRDLKAKTVVGVALERALGAAKKHNKTNEGSRTWQTLLTAAAFNRPANDDGEEEEEEEAMSMSKKR